MTRAPDAHRVAPPPPHPDRLGFVVGPAVAVPISPAILSRNRQNALRSTGPRSSAGKAVARANALKHGLTANPAIGTVEDAEAFAQLLDALGDRLRPSGPLEATLVHRIAVAIWRLQRATRAEAALGGAVAEECAAADHARVQRWIERIMAGWRPTPRELRDDLTGTVRTVWQREGLAALDELRESEMMADGAALTAMMAMLEELSERLRRFPGGFLCEQAEQLAWLMGDFAGYFPVELTGLFQDRVNLTPIGRRIAASMGRGADQPLCPQLESMIRTRIQTLAHQRRVCPVSATAAAGYRRAIAAAVPEAAAMDRLVRYEVHAERSLQRAVELLARLRGMAGRAITEAIGTASVPAGHPSPSVLRLV